MLFQLVSKPPMNSKHKIIWKHAMGGFDTSFAVAQDYSSTGYTKKFMPPKKPLLTDLLVSAFLIAATFYYAARVVDFTIPPFEDAAMLMRYSQHLAGGHGIVWNIGESPVDGATDFLFMASAALLIKLGLTVGQAIRGIGFVSHLLTVLLVYWTNRRVHHGNLFLSLFSALYLAVGTGLSYV